MGHARRLNCVGCGSHGFEDITPKAIPDGRHFSSIDMGERSISLGPRQIAVC
jgi:hypothetical protein